MIKTIQIIKEHEWLQTPSEASHDDRHMKMDKELASCDLAIVYPCDEDNVFQESIVELINSLDFDGKIVAFEQCIEKGGGGEILPTLYHGMMSSVTFLFKEGGSALIALGAAKIFTKENFNKIFRKKTSSKENEKVCCSMSNRQGDTIKYLVPSFLSTEEAENAFMKIANHFPGIYETKFNSHTVEFIYDRQTSDWLRL